MISNMNFKQCKNLIAEDYRRLSGISFLKALLLNESFRVTFWFRVFSYFGGKHGCFRLLYIISRLFLMHNSHKTGISIKPCMNVGGGLYFHHFSCIILSPFAEIGKNCTIYQGVTIGRIHSGPRAGVPRIGDIVTVFAGSKVLGNIRIGNNVTIGANSVVLNDVPDNCVVAGVPAKVLHTIKID